MLKKLGNKLLELLYPRRCPVCHQIAEPKGQKICAACRDKLRPAEGPRCFQCSKPLRNREQEYCRDCQKPRHFDQGIGIFTYGTTLQQSLYKLKYENRQEYGAFYGEFAAFYIGNKIAQWGIEAVIPIPLHKKRMEKRGYNQAAVFARAFGKSCGLSVEEKILFRSINTKPQKDLNYQERRENLKHAFRVRGELPYHRILLVDDIYTTGSTIEAAADILKQAGAEKVYFLTIAIVSNA